MIYLTYFAELTLRFLGSPIVYQPGYGIDAFTLIGYTFGLITVPFVWLMVKVAMWIGRKASEMD
jgi:uncharacterized membrane protein YjdF